MSRMLVGLATAGACAALAAPGEGAAADGARGPGHASYRLALAWHPRTYTLDGTERVSFENTRSNKVHYVWFRLWANGFGSCSHPRVTVKVLEGGAGDRKAASCTALRVRLPHELEPGKRAAVRLRFSVRVPAGEGNLGHTSGGPALLGNAIPILAVRDSSGVHLEPFSRLGEAGYSLTSAWHVTLDVSRGVRAATTGVLASSSSPSSTTRRLRFDAPRARDFELAIGSVHRASTKAGGVRIRLFDSLPGGTAAEHLRSRVLSTARSDVLRYAARFGAYGAPELDIVQTPALDGEGMEYPELVFVEMTTGSSWTRTASLIAHELAHQWFYGLVGNNQWRQPFLDESFATFASGFPSHQCTAGDPLSGFPSSVRLTSTMGFFDAHSSGWYYTGLYGGGACALRDLRAGLGTQRFDDLIRQWVASHRFGVATTGAFVAAVRAAAPAGFDVDAWLRASRIDVP